MAAKHILSLELLPVSNCDIFSIKDTSQYADNLEIDCPELLIQPPGFNAPYMIEVQPGFDLNLTACAIGLQTYDCGNNVAPYPDGIYIIKYRVQPHDKVYVEYNHLRTNTLMSNYYKKLCDLDIQPCESTSARKKILDDMRLIRTMIDAAKGKVEYCNSPDEGWDLYKFAESKLKKITCDISCC
jgi:hypothetical protein